MRCPICNMEMRLTDRQGITIDYCPQCRGIWLDRGELDKIIDRSVGLIEEPESRPAPLSKKKRGHDYIDHDDEYERDHRHTYSGKKKKHKHYRNPEYRRPKKKKNQVKDFFEDIFDIF